MKRKIVVCQIGARHRYLIPQLMYKAGMLYSLYTDSCIYSKLGRLSHFLRSIGIKNERINRLANRDPKIPQNMVKSTDLLLYKKLKNPIKNYYATIETYYQGLTDFYIKQGIKNCDIIYNMFFENIGFLRYAKKHGKIVFVDIYENPTAFANIISEIVNVPEYNKYENIKELYLAENRLRETYMNEVLGIADFYTIPSQFVLESLKAYTNFDINKVKMLPYPSSITKNVYKYSPIKHKIIWVGNDPVRKGLIYCAKAATLLKNKYTDLNFEVIGVIDKTLMNDYAFKDLNFIGVLFSTYIVC